MNVLKITNLLVEHTLLSKDKTKNSVEKWPIVELSLILEGDQLDLHLYLLLELLGPHMIKMWVEVKMLATISPYCFTK